MGCLAIGLELESQARICEEFESATLNVLNATELATSLRTLIESLGMSETVDEWYARLVDYEQQCRTMIVAEPDASREGSEPSSERVLLFPSSGDAALDHVISVARGTCPPDLVDKTSRGFELLTEHGPPTEEEDEAGA